MEKVQNALGFLKEFFYRPGYSSLVGMISYIPKLRKLRVSKHIALPKACIYTFFHSDDISSIDSNSRKVIIVDKVKNSARVWVLTTIDE